MDNDPEETQLELADEPDVPVDDEASRDDSTIAERYDITSYGADPDVEGVVGRLRKETLLIPPFQRAYVWSQREASRFIESLILGLPVPGVFFAVQPGTNKQLVIDGQQRLKTLQFFYDGYFNPRTDDVARRVFKLIDVQKSLDGCTYTTLEERDRLKLDAAVIHATIIKQESPADNDTSIFHIFERLNNGGRRLTDQEIRTALNQGPLLDMVVDANRNADWRAMFGKPHRRLKDQELVLRFFALLEDSDKYEKPMKEFLTKFLQRNRTASAEKIEEWRNAFVRTAAAASRILGHSAFRYGTSINAAVFDSVMVALARLLTVATPPTDDEIRERYERLLLDKKYRVATTRATSDETAVRNRLEIATEILANA